MSSCKDCVHYEVCGKNAVVGIDLDQFAFESRNPRAEFECLNYKPKSRFVELPCEVGDEFYTVVMRWKGKISKWQWQIERITVERISYDGENTVLEDYSGHSFTINDIGKTVFLSRELAEKALAERSK